MDFLLDKTTHDILVTNKDLTPVIDELEVAQRLTIKLRSYQSEWFRDTNYGIPWYEILSKSGNKDIIDNYIKATIQEDPNISSLTKYVSIKQGTNLKVDFTAKYSSGQTVNISLEV